MPAIQVARTDTFEQQRQKINEIGEQIFNVTAGGSDLSTGNLKLGDGSISNPSLSFVSDGSLGLYKQGTGTIGYVYSEKLLYTLSQTGFLSYRDFKVRQNKLLDSGLTIVNSGQNYDPGSYVSIPLSGGTGESATADFVVVPFIGTENQGSGYKPGNFTNIPIVGGSTASRSIANFTVDAVTLNIANTGSGYASGFYTNIPLVTVTGTGSGATANISISGGFTYNGTITGGTGYDDGTTFSVPLYNKPTQTYVVTVVGDGAGVPFQYQLDGITEPDIDFVPGNTYRFDVSDVSNADHIFYIRSPGGSPPPAGLTTITVGTRGNAGAFVDIIVSPTYSGGSIEYSCTIHQTMGGAINFITGTTGVYGFGSTADITVSGGSVTAVTFDLTGSGYKSGDILVASQLNIGFGTGFEFLINSIDNNGIIVSIAVVDSGSGYNLDDELTVNSADIGGTGSGAQFFVTSEPGIIKNFTFTSSATDYQSGDIISIPGPVSGVEATLVGSDSGSAETTFTISDVSNIVVGSTVTQTGGTGALNGLQDTLVVAIDYDTNSVTIDVDPDTSGSAILTFTPPYGDATTDFTYTIDKVGSIESVSINNPGVGYFIDDVLSVNSLDLVQPITYYVKYVDVQHLTFSPSSVVSGSFAPGDFIKIKDGTPTSTNIVSYTTINTGVAQSYNNVPAQSTSGSGVGETFTVNRDSAGEITSVIPNQTGFFYATGDTVTIAGDQVGGSTPTDNITVTVSNVTQSTPAEIYQVSESGGFIEKIVVDDISFVDLEIFVVQGTISPQYTILSASSSGSKGAYSVSSSVGVDNVFGSITLLSGNTYIFDTSDSSNIGHNFNLSTYPGGIWGSSRIENISTTVDLSVLSPSITVSSTSGIVSGMEVYVTSGNGQISSGVTVESVDSSTTLTLSANPISNGSAVLSFIGVPYSDGVSVDANSVTIKVTDFTSSPLYYYDSNDSSPDNADAGGLPGQESQVLINLNNTKVFGSGFSINVIGITSIDAINLNVVTGQVQSDSIVTGQIISTGIAVNGNINSTSISTNSVNTQQITSNDLIITASTVSFDGPNVTIGGATITNSNGNITSSGIIKSTNSISSNDRLFITNNIISTFTGNDIQLSPASNRVVKVNSSTALVIPSGNTLQRPTTLAQSGSIRFNTETNQYEGYSSATSSWSSLGGVRDLDGNTYITAEESIGSNDNTLWFYNDNINTVRFTPTHLEFRNQKSIRSSNVNAPAFTTWSANVPVVAGQYLRYRNNLYQVEINGTTGTTGSEPVHTTGTLVNGTTQLTWVSLAVAPLTFEDIEVLRIGPLGGLPVSINSDLRLSNNVISTDVNDLVFRPNSGKKVVIDSPSTLVIPAGADSDRGIPSQGSIRFSTTTSQFEGYDGANWGSLGGVKDVDQNTYIIPELSPGSNENILYFYNDNNNTLQLSTTSLDFYSVDTIRSIVSDELEITASFLTFDNGASTFDNTATDRTFLHTSKQYFDLGLSSGLTTDPVLRLDDQGDVYLNIGFGTGVFTGVKVFDGDLKEFELADVKILTDKLSLVKGTSDSGSSILYPIATASGSKTTVIAVNPTTGEKEFIEFGILDDGSNVFHTEYGNIRTGVRLIIPTFEVTGANNVRLNISLGDDINPTEIINITVVSNITKK